MKTDFNDLAKLYIAPFPQSAVRQNGLKMATYRLEPFGE
jgi:hypothetical protein